MPWATRASIASIASACRPTQARAVARQKAHATKVCSSWSMPV
ncbi:Vmc-like lipoprotein signal peptide domain-containing protein [Microbacterium sp. P26]